jgi:hypothetical protein
MSGGGTTADKVENKDPWAPAQGYLQDIMAKSQQTYNSGAGQGVYGGQRVAGLDPATLTGIGRINAVCRFKFRPRKGAVQRGARRDPEQRTDASLQRTANDDGRRLHGRQGHRDRRRLRQSHQPGADAERWGERHSRLSCEQSGHHQRRGLQSDRQSGGPHRQHGARRVRRASWAGARTKPRRGRNARWRDVVSEPYDRIAVRTGRAERGGANEFGNQSRRHGVRGRCGEKSVSARHAQRQRRAHCQSGQLDCCRNGSLRLGRAYRCARAILGGSR